MKPRALAIDLDGTLLVGEDLSTRNRDAVRRAHDAGIAVIIATARWRQMAERIAQEIGLTGPLIACSGAQVHLPQERRDLFDARLPEDFTRALYEICNAERCIATITVQDHVRIKMEGEPAPGVLDEEMRWVPELVVEDALPRIAAIQGTRANERIRSELEPRFSDSVNFHDSIGPTGKIIITLTAKAADKGEALAVACDHLGIDPQTCVAFGDADNDIAMFRRAGMAVAMGQASADVQAAADRVTLRNDEDGVAAAIDTLLSETN